MIDLVWRITHDLRGRPYKTPRFRVGYTPRPYGLQRTGGE